MTTPVQHLASRVAGVFLVVGVLGCLPGVTVHLDDAPFTGPGAAALLGLLPVTLAGNLLHLSAAATGVVAASTPRSARGYLLWLGAVYSVLCLRSIAVGTAASNANVDGDTGLWCAFAWGLLVLVLGLVVTRTGELRAWRAPLGVRPGDGRV
jgi:hypothetical protein